MTGLGALAIAIALTAGLACSSAAPSAPGGAASPATSDASIADAGPADVGLVLDARPAPPTPGPPGVTSDDASAQCTPSPGGACGLDPQCGCPSTETCDLGDDDLAACTSAGTAPAGHACVSTASCAQGLTCVDGACRAFCGTRGDAGCAGPESGGPCVPLVGQDGGVVQAVCTFACALEDPSACGATGSIAAGCAIFDADAGLTDCVLAGPQPDEADCAAQACAPGLVCVTFDDAGGSSVCRRWCRFGRIPDDCGPTGPCQEFPQPVYAHGFEYGFCP